ncbi:hypothetical protein MW887_004855 [Aspergillus wentii]|nr:hypothetical protein MW887_004855 [Aspergillus wentii]
MVFNITIDPTDQDDRSDDSSSVQASPSSSKPLPGPRRSTERFWPPVDTSTSGWDIRSSDKDVTVHLDLEAGLDVTGDLERLSELNRLGRFSEGIKLFHERLAPHLDFFPVVAEYADLLLEQGDFGALIKLADEESVPFQEKFDSDQVLLLKLLVSLAGMHTKGALLPALERAEEVVKYFGKSLNLMVLSGVQIQLMDAYLRIIVYVAQHSTYLESKRFQPLWKFEIPETKITERRRSLYSESYSDESENDVSEDEYLPRPRHKRHRSPQSPVFMDYDEWTHLPYPDEPKASQPEAKPPKTDRNYPQLGEWYRLLAEDGFFWDSHRLLCCVLPLLGDAQGRYKPDGSFEDFFSLDEIDTAPDVLSLSSYGSVEDEQKLIAEFANCSLLSEFFNGRNQTESIAKIQRKFAERTKSLAASIVSSHPHLFNSRPYLDWILSESTKASPRPDATLLSHDVVTRWKASKQASTEQRVRGRNMDSKNTVDKAISIVKDSALKLGDYRLQTSLLQTLHRQHQDFDANIQTIRELTHLQQDTMADIPGYIQSVLEEYMLIEYFQPPNLQSLRKDLYNRLSEFDKTFPYGPSLNPETRKQLKITLFDNALVKWMELSAQDSLLRSMNRDIEAELIKTQFPDVERHIPSFFAINMGIEARCTGCHYCGTNKEGVPNSDVFYHSIPPSLLPLWSDDNPRLSVQPDASTVPAASTGPKRGSNRVPLGIQSRSQADQTKDEDVLNIEEMIKSRQGERRTRDVGKPVQRSDTRHIIKYDRRSRPYDRVSFNEDAKSEDGEEKQTETTTSNSDAPIILNDTTGRKFSFPYRKCRTWKGMEKLMQDAFEGDETLSPQIVNGNYEILDSDGSIILPFVWKSIIKPGSVVTLHPKAAGKEELPQPALSDGERNRNESKDIPDIESPDHGQKNGDIEIDKDLQSTDVSAISAQGLWDTFPAHSGGEKDETNENTKQNGDGALKSLQPVAEEASPSVSEGKAE